MKIDPLTCPFIQLLIETEQYTFGCDCSASEDALRGALHGQVCGITPAYRDTVRELGSARSVCNDIYLQTQFFGVISPGHNGAHLFRREDAERLTAKLAQARKSLDL